jgi:hypothetical protein
MWRYGDFANRLRYTLHVGFVSAGLATVTVGYILGVWTGCAIFSRLRGRDDRGASERSAARASIPIPEVTMISAPRA